MIKYALSVKQSLLFTHLSFVGCQKKYFQKALHLDYEFPEVLYRDGDILWNFENDVDFNREFLKNKTFNQAVGDFIKALTKASKNLEKVTNRHPFFNQYIEAYLKNMPFLFHFWNVEYLVISQLKKDFKSLFKKNAETILQKVLVPSKDTYFTRERKSLEKIKRYLDSPRLQTMIKKHIDTFGFTAVVFGIGKPLDECTLLERLKSKFSVERDDKKRAQKILKRLLPHRKVYERVKLAQELMFWKNQRLDILFRCDYLMMPLFTKIANLMGITYREFLYLTYVEIREWFKNKSVPAKSILKKRMQWYALYLKDGKISLYLNKKDYPVVKDDTKTKVISDSKVLKGNIAYKGKVKGKVKLVFGAEDIKKIEKGDILVAKMTRPEMIVGLEEAAAFITDEGGMLSHAAIVAREMRKPCIVGTKVGTKVLKDGDYVEVDANKGIIKIIAVY